MKKLTNCLLIVTFCFTLIFDINAQKSKRPGEKYFPEHRITILVNSKNLLIVRAENPNKQKRLNYTLKIFSEYGDVIYFKPFLKKGSIYCGYDLSNLPEGKYTFKIIKGLKTIYSKSFLNKIKVPGYNIPENELIVEEIKN